MNQIHKNDYLSSSQCVSILISIVVATMQYDTDSCRVRDPHPERTERSWQELMQRKHKEQQNQGEEEEKEDTEDTGEASGFRGQMEQQYLDKKKRKEKLESCLKSNGVELRQQVEAFLNILGYGEVPADFVIRLTRALKRKCFDSRDNDVLSNLQELLYDLRKQKTITNTNLNILETFLRKVQKLKISEVVHAPNITQEQAHTFFEKMKQLEAVLQDIAQLKRDSAQLKQEINLLGLGLIEISNTQQQHTRALQNVLDGQYDIQRLQLNIFERQSEHTTALGTGLARLLAQQRSEYQDWRRDEMDLRRDEMDFRKAQLAQENTMHTDRMQQNAFRERRTREEIIKEAERKLEEAYKEQERVKEQCARRNEALTNEREKIIQERREFHKTLNTPSRTPTTNSGGGGGGGRNRRNRRNRRGGSDGSMGVGLAALAALGASAAFICGAASN